MLDLAGYIEDSALDVPVSINALVHAAKADDAVARALVAKRNPVFEAAAAEREAKGKAEGKAEALLDVLVLRSVAVDDATRARILGEQDLAQLKRWLRRAMTCATAAELFDEP